MATVTPNYSWPVPTSTDLVKDGAVAIEALGDAIDASVFAGAGSGLVRINSTTVTAQSTVNIDNVFTSTYRNYKIVVALTTIATTGALSLRLRAGGTTNSSNNYTHAGIGALSSNATTNSYSNGLASDWQIGFVVNAFAGLSSSELCIYNPQQSQYATMTGTTMSTSATTNNYMFALGGLMNVTTAYDGFAFSAAGNMTGVIRVYGLRD